MTRYLSLVEYGWLVEQVTGVEAADQTKFKDAFAAETGVSVERVIATLLAAKREKMRSPDLHGLLAAMLDAPAEPPGPGLTVLDPHR